MTDIVERLRSRDHAEPIDPKAIYRTRSVQLFEEAADEIVRLREELAKSKKQAGMDHDWANRAANELVDVRDQVAAVKTENERLHTRLEDDRVWTVDVISGERTLERVVPGSLADGIECRDDTIRLLEDRFERQSAELMEAKEAWKAAHELFAEDVVQFNAQYRTLKARALEVVRPFAGISTLADVDRAIAFVRELGDKTDA